MSRPLRARLGLLLVLSATLVWTPEGAARGLEATAPDACGGAVPALEQAMSQVAVSVQLVGLGGPPPAPFMPTPAPQPIGPAVGVTVQALAPDAPNVAAAEAVTDAQGQATLDLPPDRYWIVVPAAAGLPGVPGAPTLPVLLPNGTRASAYRELTLGAGEVAALPLAITLVMP